MQSHGVIVTKSVSAMALILEPQVGAVEIDVPVECDDYYYEAVIKNAGYNPRYPTPFEQRVIILTAKHLVGCLDARQIEGQPLAVVVLAPYETLKEVKLIEDRTLFPGDKTASLSLVLNIIVESVDRQSGEFIRRTIPFGLAKANARHH